jgi:hypothetical protein
MKIEDQLHKSKSHRDGYDPSCGKCVREGGIKAILLHLVKCAKQNEADASEMADPASAAIAAEQRRIISILRRLL